MNRENLNRILQKLIHFIVFVSICFTIINNVVYIHTHKMSDGSIIVHAHPFKKTDTNNIPVKSHKHTHFEYVVLDHLLLFVLFYVAILAIILALTIHKQFFYKFQYLQKIGINQFYLRGPPSRF
jgi:hypothetical protein